MAIHLVRDYLTQDLTATARRYMFGYMTAIFLRRILGYTYVGDTNYPINATGSLLIATGDTTPTAATPTFTTGRKAGINLGSQKEFYVSIPASVRIVSAADLGRLLVLKSSAYPTFNSGIFNIIGFETSTNSYVVDYRTLGDKPPVEASDSIMWWLYERDGSTPTVGSNNTKGASEYRGDGDSTTPRIILQSPHAIGWQVRICHEPTTHSEGNFTATQNCAYVSLATGFDGNSAGDFLVQGRHAHAPMWYNTSSNNYLGMAVGFHVRDITTMQMRITMVGDDTGQGVVVYGRNPSQNGNPWDQIACFGLAENEPTPLPINNHSRLFTIGSCYNLAQNGTTGNIGNDGGLFAWKLQSSFSTGAISQGASSTLAGVPTQVGASMWAFVSGTTMGNGPQTTSLATDCPFTNATELLPIDLVQGTLVNQGWNDTPVLPVEPRIMGTMPHIKLGRANFGQFSPTTDDARSYQHLKRGLYIPWNGPNIIP